MSVTDELIQKIRLLPESQRQEVLRFVEQLGQKDERTRRPPNKLYGLCADIRSDLTFEDFKQNRREMWRNPVEDDQNDNGDH